MVRFEAEVFVAVIAALFTALDLASLIGWRRATPPGGAARRRLAVANACALALTAVIPLLVPSALRARLGSSGEELSPFDSWLATIFVEHSWIGVFVLLPGTVVVVRVVALLRRERPTIAAIGFAIGFVGILVITTIFNVLRSAIPVDLNEHGSYFVVVRIPYDIIAMTAFGWFSAVYLGWPQVAGRGSTVPFGSIHAGVAFVAFAVTNYPMHLALGTRSIRSWDPLYRCISLATTCAQIVFASMTLLLAWRLLVLSRRPIVARRRVS